MDGDSTHRIHQISICCSKEHHIWCMYAARVRKGCRSKKLTWSACLLDDCLIRFKNTTQFNTLATHKITIAIVIVGWIWWWRKWRRWCSRPGMSSPAVRGCLKATKKTNEWLLLLKPTACSTLSKRVAWFSLLFSFVFSSFSWCFVSFSGENYDNLFLTTAR